MRVFFFLHANGSARPDAREADMKRLRSCPFPLLHATLKQLNAEPGKRLFGEIHHDKLLDARRK